MCRVAVLHSPMLQLRGLGGVGTQVSRVLQGCVCPVRKPAKVVVQAMQNPLYIDVAHHVSLSGACEHRHWLPSHVAHTPSPATGAAHGGCLCCGTHG
jgi:hypothetical protein